jgi:hypothetical protein
LRWVEWRAPCLREACGKSWLAARPLRALSHPRLHAAGMELACQPCR